MAFVFTFIMCKLSQTTHEFDVKMVLPTYLPTYLPTPWCRILFEKLIVTQIVKQ